MLKENWIKTGLIAAATVNIGDVLLISRGFSNGLLNEADSVFMSNFGLLLILVLDLTYLGIAFVRGNIA